MALLFGSHETQAIDIHDLADDLTVCTFRPSEWERNREKESARYKTIWRIQKEYDFLLAPCLCLSRSRCCLDFSFVGSVCLLRWRSCVIDFWPAHQVGHAHQFLPHHLKSVSLDDLLLAFLCLFSIWFCCSGLFARFRFSIIVTERRRFVVTDPTETTPFATAAPIPPSASTANAAAVVVRSSLLSPSGVAGVVTPVAGASSTPASPASAAAAALLASGRGTEIGLSFGADVGTVPMLLHRRTSDVERGIEQGYHALTKKITDTKIKRTHMKRQAGRRMRGLTVLLPAKKNANSDSCVWLDRCVLTVLIMLHRRVPSSFSDVRVSSFCGPRGLRHSLVCQIVWYQTNCEERGETTIVETTRFQYQTGGSLALTKNTNLPLLCVLRCGTWLEVLDKARTCCCRLTAFSICLLWWNRCSGIVEDDVLWR